MGTVSAPLETTGNAWVVRAPVLDKLEVVDAAIIVTPALIARTTEAILNIDDYEEEDKATALYGWVGRRSVHALFDAGMQVPGWSSGLATVSTDLATLSPDRLLPFVVPSEGVPTLRVIEEADPLFDLEQRFTEATLGFLLDKEAITA